MKVTPPLARRFLYLRLLVGSLVLGAFYDLTYAVVMVTAPQVPANMFNLPLPPPEGTFYLWILAVVLAMLAALYLLAARDPRRYSGIIAVAVAGRILGGLVLLAAALRGLPGLYPMAVADLVFGIAHAAFWLPIRS